MTERRPLKLRERFEDGSDEMLARIGDMSALDRVYRAERRRHDREEQALRRIGPATDEPGRDYPDPDEAPPMDQAHPEFDPTPPD